MEPSGFLGAFFMFVLLYDVAARDFARFSKEYVMAAPSDKLSKAERDVIIEALEFKERSFSRAAKASSGAISKAYEDSANTVSVLIAKVKSYQLEL